MDTVVGREDHTMNLARSLPNAPLTTFVKGMGGCAFFALCLTGAVAGSLNVPFGFTTQLLASAVGAMIGGVIIWYGGRTSTQG